MIVVVGANGFLGRHLLELLSRLGEPTTAITRWPDDPFFLDLAPTIERMSAEFFTSAAGDQVIAKAKAIVYLLWASVPMTFAEVPWQEVEANVEPAFRFFLRVARLAPEARLVFLSSGGTIYGRGPSVPKSETSAIEPISAYGLGKLLAEEALRFSGRSSGAPFSILRVSNAVGRWQANPSQGIVGAALRAARDGVALKLYGGGTQVRDFVDADDVAAAICAASLDVRHNDAVWNVGSGAGIAVADLIDRISQEIRQEISVEHLPARSMDVPYIVLDCRKVKRDLGWEATTSLQHSICDLWNRICRARDHAL